MSPARTIGTLAAGFISPRLEIATSCLPCLNCWSRSYSWLAPYLSSAPIRVLITEMALTRMAFSLVQYRKATDRPHQEDILTDVLTDILL